MTLRPFLDQTPRVADSALIDPSAVLIGDVEVGPDSSFWPFAVARGDVNTIRVGARSNVQDGTVLHVTHDNPQSPGGHPLVIGDDVTVGHNCTLHGCTIHGPSLIGMGSIVLDGAVVEPGVMVGAGSLVPPGKVLTGNSLWLGSPVRRVRALTEEEIARLRYSAAHYVRLVGQYRQTAAAVAGSGAT